MALDTLTQALKVDCCWIQTISGKNRKLDLAAERGFNVEMRREIAGMEAGHSFSEQVIGLGHKIVIPDLANDGAYGIPSFRKTGYRWLVAVPLMTYRVYGILGAASRHRKLLKKETPELMMVISGMIATALSKSYLSGADRPSAGAARDTKQETKAPLKKPEPPANVKKTHSPPEKPAKRPDGAFHSHARRMENFRRSHR
jgi:signal transduction protein with GAF and PtsI domain